MTHSKHLFAVILGISLGLTVSLVSCRKTAANDIPAADSSSFYSDDFHADNDIAMTIRSITDALRVGEPLDTLDYNFEGVLTDGEGHPLYTDIQGTPGTWDVDVISTTSAVVRNIYLGDLLPDDLESYLAGSLNLTPENIIETAEYDDDEETQLVVYDIDGVYLRIETRAAVAPNGLEGPLMSIIATTTPPTIP